MGASGGRIFFVADASFVADALHLGALRGVHQEGEDTVQNFSQGPFSFVQRLRFHVGTQRGTLRGTQRTRGTQRARN